MQIIHVIGIGILLTIISLIVKGQGTQNAPITLPSEQLTLSTNKTTNIIFPYEIKSVDRGSRDVLVQVTKGTLNILQLKAARRDFPVTNITVITSDGHLYSFMASYGDDPGRVNISFKPEGSPVTSEESGPVQFTARTPDARALIADDSLIRNGHLFLHISSGSERMILSLRGMYYKDGLMWLILQLHNNSLLAYFPEQFRFTVEDRKKVKRTAVQEKEEQPVYSSIFFPDYGRQSGLYLFAFHPFTLPKDQCLNVQVREQFGGRILLLKVKHKVVLKTKWVKP